ncbi:MAG TPA: MFS transporter [Thermomicrobiales bacterium]|nr:MFS transporter [Thermomicrobiales bacterium]
MTRIPETAGSVASAVSSSAPTTETLGPETTSKLAILRNRALTTLMLGHFTVDMYVGVIPMLYPLLRGKFDLSLETVGYISLAYGGAASLSQPMFGILADRKGTRLVGLALLWTATTFALLGFAPSFGWLIVVAALSGLGSGLYHPLGALNARAVIDERERNTAMSIYVTGGTLGVASGPLVGAFILWTMGLHGTALMLIPGAVICPLMLRQGRSIAAKVPRRARDSSIPLHPIPMATMAIIVGLMMLRAWTISGVQTFLPTWYDELGYGKLMQSALVTTLLLSTALGTVGSGTLADRYGRKVPLILSSALSVPTILLFAQFPGPWAFLTAALMGFLAASTLPLLLVIAQELMAGRAGLASGLIMGLGFAMSAIGIPITGYIGDLHGLQNAMRFQAVIGLATFGLAVWLPNEARIRQLTGRE